MDSVTTLRFRQAFDRLPKKIQVKARSTYHLWKHSPHHPGINYKQIHSSELIYSVRVGMAYRALGVLNENTMVWFWIGSHADYNELIKSL